MNKNIVCIGVGYRGRNLFFSTDIEAAVKACDIIFVGIRLRNTGWASSG